MEVLDSEQNYRYNAHYLSFNFDLSNIIMFSTTDDNIYNISLTLLNRMEIV